jgi:CubicO group peptidase (beta-lactamase class C family)
VRALGRADAVDADTLFGMMSTTKAMTALAIAMLVDEGKVAWDDPVSRHLPWFQLPDPYLTGHVTLRDALRHTSGVENADLLWDREDLTTREVLERMRFVPATAALRSNWVYHNVMYQAAGEIVSAASGMPWERFVATRILEPLGMTRSAAMYPTAGLVGSRWTTYGLGWLQQDYRGRYVAMHTGSMDGRTAIVGLVPEERLGVYVLGNLDHAEFRHALLWKTIDLWTGAPDRDWNAECLALYGGLKDEQKRAQAAREAARVANTRPAHALEAYAGTYGHPAWGRVEVALEGGTLSVSVGPSPRNRGLLEHWHYDTFRTRPGDGRQGWLYLDFDTGQDGTVRALRFSDTMLFARVADRPRP